MMRTAATTTVRRLPPTIECGWAGGKIQNTDASFRLLMSLAVFRRLSDLVCQFISNNRQIVLTIDIDAQSQFHLGLRGIDTSSTNMMVASFPNDQFAEIYAPEGFQICLSQDHIKDFCSALNQCVTSNGLVAMFIADAYCNENGVPRSNFVSFLSCEADEKISTEHYNIVQIISQILTDYQPPAFSVFSEYERNPETYFSFDIPRNEMIANLTCVCGSKRSYDTIGYNAIMLFALGRKGLTFTASNMADIGAGSMTVFQPATTRQKQRLQTEIQSNQIHNRKVSAVLLNKCLEIHHSDSPVVKIELSPLTGFIILEFTSVMKGPLRIALTCQSENLIS